MIQSSQTHQLHTAWERLALLSLLLSTACAVDALEDPIFQRESALTAGAPLKDLQDDGYYTAVVGIPGCSATLISHEAVLTAAHCVCPTETSTAGCSTRSTVTFPNVRRADDRSTPNVDESLFPRTRLTISGNVTVHPDYGALGWLRKDYALIALDTPVYDVASGVVPMPIADPSFAPSVDDLVILAGYGRTGFDCDQALQGLVGYAHIFHMEPDAIRVDREGAIACKGDSGGPMFDFDTFVLGTASWNAGGDATYRPIYEEKDWAQAIIDPLITSADVQRFVVSRGTSWDLGKDHDVYKNYQPASGIVGQSALPNGGRVYTWYANGTYSIGWSWDLTEHVERKRYTLPAPYTPEDIVGMGFSSSGALFTWFSDGKVCTGRANRLNSVRAPYAYSTPSGLQPSDIVGIDIAHNDYVYTWYKNGVRSVGNSSDLDYFQTGSYVAAAGMTPQDIVEVAISEVSPGIDRVFTWYRPQ